MKKTVAAILLLFAGAFAIAHGPGIPPDPWDQIRVAHGPGMPPNPWDQRA